MIVHFADIKTPKLCLRSPIAFVAILLNDRSQVLICFISEHHELSKPSLEAGYFGKLCIRKLICNIHDRGIAMGSFFLTQENTGTQKLDLFTHLPQ